MPIDTHTVIVQEADFDSAALGQQLRKQTQGQAGALVTFTGYVRDYDVNAPTKTLYLEHYPGMCEREIAEICATARQRWPVAGTLAVHRVGQLAHTDQIVFIAVASRHRTDAFRACEYIIDALKTRAPFWKRETLDSGETFWVQQQASDAHKTEAWSKPDQTSA